MKKIISFIVCISIILMGIPLQSMAAESFIGPKLLDKYPESEDSSVWFNELDLTHDLLTSKTSFIKAVFEYVYEPLKLNVNLMKNSMIRAEGSGINMVDTDFINPILDMSYQEQNEYIDKYMLINNANKATLYIPVRPLRSQTTYLVTIPAGTVSETVSERVYNNGTIEWSFTTTTTPFVGDITMGSVPENYDSEEPIYIEGDFFHDSTIQVYFNDTRASSARVIPGTETEKSILEVYLPSGSNRLTEGTYDIIVQNDDDHQRVIYGAFSIVKAGGHIPNEEFQIKKSERKGEVQSNIKVSEDVLLLDSRYADDRQVELNLDEWMGEEVLIRKIQFEGDRKNTMGILQTKSKWANISLYNVTLDTNTEDEDISITVGRIEPSIQQSLSQKLRGKAIKSDFIQVIGENYTMGNVWLQIPLKNSSGKNLKVLRYDEETRNFYEEISSINLVEQRIEVTSQSKGIFVVVEK